LIVWALAQDRGDGHRSVVTLERVLIEYNEDLIFFESIAITARKSITVVIVTVSLKSFSAVCLIQ